MLPNWIKKVFSIPTIPVEVKRGMVGICSSVSYERDLTIYHNFVPYDWAREVHGVLDCHFFEVFHDTGLWIARDWNRTSIKSGVIYPAAFTNSAEDIDIIATI